MKKQNEQSETTNRSETSGPSTVAARTKARAVKTTAPHITHADKGRTAAERHADHLRANGHKDGVAKGLAGAASCE